MKIRYGAYVLYKGYEMDLWDNDRDGLPVEERMFGLSYDADSNPKLEGFWKDQYDWGGHIENKYRKGVYLKDLDNAFSIQTKALFKGYVFDVYTYYLKEKSIDLNTKDKAIAKELNFETDRAGMIKLSKIEKLWEERTPSEYDLPMPKGLEKIKVIFDRTNK